jgi:hypothetical protein
MPKQIKLGLDKGFSREVSSDQILVDVRGNLLEDAAGNPLYTSTTDTPTSFFSAKNSTSVHINNEPSNVVSQGKAIAIQELFKETSEVSSSLLGIPRLGKQQSLLSDVSIYGLDENTWEFYRSPNPFQPAEWSTRLNNTYGNRYNARLNEYDKEQALALELFPTPWNFPFGPKWKTRYDATLFKNYQNFINLGNFLYEYFLSKNLKRFAEKYFLIPDMATDDTSDVIYNANFQLSLRYIEQWTITWMDIRDGNKLPNPLSPGKFLNAAFVNQRFVSDALGFGFDQTQPGYSSSSYRYCQLQSKEAFRYQPGAISGFTFGVRLNSDPATLVNVLEWGAANDTDQLMFQVRGSQFNIVRRSTVPLTAKTLELMGLTPEDQVVVDAPNPFERNDNSYTTTDLGLPGGDRGSLHELVIQQDVFNGDPLNGSGPSGYNISFNEVTMYKIEYSWYGAIGAKFYVYIPVGNEEARWVLVHTLIIENTLDKPSLQNPFMHFRYSISMGSTSSLREPVYLYKYGASYYIDGSDEGTFAYNSYTIPTEKEITSVNSKPIIGFLPKDAIKNRDGISTINQKNFYIESISTVSQKNARLDVIECEGCPGGHGQFYATSLHNGISGLTDTFKITTQGNLQYVDTEKEFSAADDNKKIIGPGVYSSYVFTKDIGGNFDAQELQIRRRLGTDRINSPVGTETFNSNDTAIINGVETRLRGIEFVGRLSGYDDIVASSTPLRKPNIKVQFLNPISLDSSGQWAEFRIGITSKKPVIEQVEIGEDIVERLLFDGNQLNMDEEIYGEFSHYDIQRNLQGVETGEQDTRIGNIMEQDFRLRSPTGSNSGLCSELTFQIQDRNFTNVLYVTEDPSEELEGSHFLIFQEEPPNLLGGSIGTWNGNKFVDSGFTFVSESVNYISEEGQRYSVAISGNIGEISEEGISLKFIRTFGRFLDVSKTGPFVEGEYYLFIAMRDSAKINNIVIKEFDSDSAFSHTPSWIKDETSNIQEVQVENPLAPSSIIDKTSDSEYIGLDGLFYMGGITNTGNVPANFIEKNRLDSVRFDDQLALPLRPSLLKTSVYIGANKSETIDMRHIFGVNRFKVTKGSFNNKTLYFSSIVTDPEEQGTILLSITGKEQ